MLLRQLHTFAPWHMVPEERRHRPITSAIPFHLDGLQSYFELGRSTQSLMLNTSWVLLSINSLWQPGTTKPHLQIQCISSSAALGMLDELQWSETAPGGSTSQEHLHDSGSIRRMLVLPCALVSLPREPATVQLLTTALPDLTSCFSAMLALTPSSH